MTQATQETVTDIPVSKEEQALYDQLEKIFGTPKETLTAAEQARETEILNKIDGLFDAGKTSLDEQALQSLTDQLDILYGVKPYSQLTAAEKKQADDLYSKLDGLYGNELPEVSKQEQALLDQLDKILGTPKEKLTDAEQKTEAQLHEKIDALFSKADGEVDEAALQALDDQLSELYGIKPYSKLSDAEKQQVDKIEQQLAELYQDPLSKQEQALFDQLDKIMGTPKAELTEAEQKAEAQLNEKIDALFSKADGEVDEAALQALDDQLSELYGIKPYSKLNDAEKQQVDGIFAKLDTLEEETGLADMDTELFDFDSETAQEVFQELMIGNTGADLDGFSDFMMMEQISDTGMFSLTGDSVTYDHGDWTTEPVGVADFDMGYDGFLI